MKCSGCYAELGTFCTVFKLAGLDKSTGTPAMVTEIVRQEEAEAQEATSFCYPGDEECSHYVRTLFKQVSEV